MDRIRTGSRRRLAMVAALVGVVAALVAAASSGAASRTAVTTYNGTLADGAAYLIQAPADWNGTLVLYSHGYVVPGSPNPARDVGDPLTGQWLLDHGYALAGSSYSTTGWAIEQAIPDQIATIDKFTTLVGTPTRTIAWGHSLGGIITAGLLQEHPDRFTGALPMCGVVAGGVATWNQALDSTFAIKVLLAPNLQIVHITSPLSNFLLAQAATIAAQATPQGRARLALAAAFGDTPGWFTTGSPEPAADDYGAQEANQFLWDTQVDNFFVFDLRAELEARAGGNPSWNTGVNYAKQLENSADFAEVQALYAAAGLDLNADIATLNAAPRISADPNAVAYLTQNVVFDGDLSGRPVLTMHTTGDGLVVNQDEQAYRSAVQRAGDQSLLRETFVHRAGHCSFTPAETISAFQTLVHRIDTGTWAGTTDPDAMNAAAAALGSTFNIAPSSFIDFEPTQFLRPFDLVAHGH
jgi:pimeloyl-ACP methyl ester carboxylesterase